MSLSVEQQRANWDALASAWEEHAATLYAWRLPLHDLLADRVIDPRLDGGGTYLDFASGVGEPGATLSRRWPRARVVAADVSTAMVACAERRAHALGLTNFEARHFDGDPRSLGQTFDGATCCFGLEYVSDPTLFFGSMAAALNPGARLMIVSWGARAENSQHTAFIDALVDVFGTAFGADVVFRFAGEVEALVREACAPSFRLVASEGWAGEARFSDVNAYVRLRQAIAPGNFRRAIDGWTEQQYADVCARILERNPPAPDGSLRFTGAVRVFTLVRVT